MKTRRSITSTATVLGMAALACGTYAGPAAATPNPPTATQRLSVAAGATATPPTAQTRELSTAGQQRAASKVVYLTFDDGPRPIYTSQILTALRQHGAKATFFMVGKSVKAHPALVRDVRARGHAIGNHTYSHPDLTKLTRAQITTELASTDALLGWRRCFRPPYGALNANVRSVAAARGQRIVLWTVDPRDWSRPGSSVIVSRVLTNIRPGSVVLFHDGGGNRRQTVEAVRTILPWLARNGYVTKTLPRCR